MLALLDASAAFDTIDHEVLLKRLSISYGTNGDALQWFQSYLSDRMQTVVVGSEIPDSAASQLTRGVPQCLVLGPLLYIL